MSFSSGVRAVLSDRRCEEANMSEIIEAARMLSPETIPVSVNILPAAWLK